jgi:hypothetical protein
LAKIPVLNDGQLLFLIFYFLSESRWRSNGKLIFRFFFCPKNLQHNPYFVAFCEDKSFEKKFGQNSIEELRNGCKEKKSGLKRWDNEP